MVASRALRATRCATCRLALLRNFTSVTGLSIRAPQISRRFSPNTAIHQKARFSSLVAPQSQQRDIDDPYHAKIYEEVHTEAQSNHQEPFDDVEVSSVPWYIQVAQPRKVPQPLSERQRIPDLPDSSPPILEPLLQQISIDLGLDDLSLLDLRKLDPPPALGANLLMILGTARSEKHLHVSADRLCRWLRSTYQLRPDADGLLGRNELKLKLRRKSRRAKLLGNGSDLSNDDGVRTGWVCVDVGVVDSIEDGTDGIPERKGYVGFGKRTDGVRIVVQMLTEEKREEIDLEKLWGGILQRGGQSEIEGAEEGPSQDSVVSTIRSNPPASYAARQEEGSGKGPSSTSTQSRGFHTTARHLSVPLAVQPSVKALSPNNDSPSANGNETVNWKDLQQSVILAIGESNYDKAMSDLMKHSNEVPQLQSEGWQPFLFEQLKRHLESTPQHRAIGELGTGFLDISSTPFLTCFYQSISPFPSQSEGEARIWLHCIASELGHHGYPLHGSLDLLEALHLAGVKISLEVYLRLLRSVLRPNEILRNKYYRIPRVRIEGAFAVLQTMHDQGLDVLTEDVFMVLQEAVALEAAVESTPTQPLKLLQRSDFNLTSSHMSPLQRRVHNLMITIDTPSFCDESRLRLLGWYSGNNYWFAFWDVWRWALRQGKPQSASLYAFMFSRVAETRNQKACMTVLRTWVPDMERELPAVKLEGDVAAAVKACLIVADPYVEQDVVGDPELQGEWSSLWRRCADTPKF